MSEFKSRPPRLKYTEDGKPYIVFKIGKKKKKIFIKVQGDITKEKIKRIIINIFKKKRKTREKNVNVRKKRQIKNILF